MSPNAIVGASINQTNERPRRLRVSALAAVANPSYSRLDTWNLLDDDVPHLHVVHRAGLETARVKRWLDRLGRGEV